MASRSFVIKTLKMLQEDISKAVIHYMSENGVGFNELVRKLGKSPTQVSKIIKGEANLTLATVAQILMGHKPHLVAA
jgi:plasmid maintenance system antidote protein VapI